MIQVCHLGGQLHATKENIMRVDIAQMLSRIAAHMENWESCAVSLGIAAAIFLLGLALKRLMDNQ